MLVYGVTVSIVQSMHDHAVCAYAVCADAVCADGHIVQIKHNFMFI